MAAWDVRYRTDYRRQTRCRGDVVIMSENSEGYTVINAGRVKLAIGYWKGYYEMAIKRGQAAEADSKELAWQAHGEHASEYWQGMSSVMARGGSVYLRVNAAGALQVNVYVNEQRETFVLESPDDAFALQEVLSDWLSTLKPAAKGKTRR